MICRLHKKQVIRMETRTAELAEELSKLYGKAKTKEEYEEVIRRGKEIRTMLEGEFPDTIASVLLSFYWAKYYLILKFSSLGKDRMLKSTSRIDFFCELEKMLSQIKDPDNRVALLYLESVILSNLLGDQNGAEKYIISIDEIISEEKVSIASVLRFINSRIVKEMADKNWSEAVEISKEIERFPKEILEQPENLRHSANIFNNRGASLVRGDIDIAKGRENLLIARGYYLREIVLSEGHLDGIKNRLREADEKS